MTVTDPCELAPDIFDRISQLALAVHGTVPAGAMPPEQVLEEVTAAAVAVLGGVDHAGITLVRRSTRGRHPEYLESTAATGEAPRRFDKLQHELGEGPCFEAIWTHQTVHIPDHAHEERWPQLRASVLDQTPISMLARRLVHRDHPTP